MASDQRAAKPVVVMPTRQRGPALHPGRNCIASKGRVSQTRARATVSSPLWAALFKSGSSARGARASWAACFAGFIAE